MKWDTMPSDASPQRMRVGAELRRLREAAGLSGDQVARELGWSQPKVSRIEMGRTSFTIRDVAALLALYGVREDDVRDELLAATADDIGESAWIVRAGAYPRRQASMAALESVTKKIRQYHAALVPGLLQTRDYAWHIAKACGATDPDAIADGRMRRQEMLSRRGGPSYEVVLDARALLLRPGPIDLLRDQAQALAERATRPRIEVRVIPVGALTTAFSTAGFALYEFRSSESPSVAWIESLAGDTYFAASEDIALYNSTFDRMQDLALGVPESISYLQWFGDDVERFLIQPPQEVPGSEAT
jgi:transcriptional regulator with XRE-family HTH domain